MALTRIGLGGPGKTYGTIAAKAASIHVTAQAFGKLIANVGRLLTR